LVTTPVGHELVTGGDFGLEGSLLTTALIVLVTVLLCRSSLQRPQPEMVAMWARYPAGFGLDPVVVTEDARGEDVTDASLSGVENESE
jgi:hypothetical protein